MHEAMLGSPLVTHVGRVALDKGEEVMEIRENPHVACTTVEAWRRYPTYWESAWSA